MNEIEIIQEWEIMKGVASLSGFCLSAHPDGLRLSSTTQEEWFVSLASLRGFLNGWSAYESSINEHASE